MIRTIVIGALLACVLHGCATPPQSSPSPRPRKSVVSPSPTLTPVAAANADATALRLLRQMTQEEKLSYVGGDRELYIRPLPRLGIPEIKLSDGPLGCANWGLSTAYPATIGLAATFDQALATEVGRAMARDCRARGVHIILAPGVNIQRSPLNGRNFEYLGEDPVLAGTLATELVRGIQSEGVLATVKHFAANSQEWDRNHVSSEVDERTLREIYFPAFEKVVRVGHVGVVMSSYNLLNGIYASHHPWLLKTVLKYEWGFQGFVMSDWTAVHDPIGGALGGCDLEMPRAREMSPRNLRSLIDSGACSIAEIDEKVRRILRTLIAAGFFEREQLRKDIPLDDPASRRVALEGARRSLVLLKNDNDLLPFDASKIKRIALVGPNAHPAVHGGAGSAYVTPLHAVSVRDGLSQIAPNVQIAYHPGIQQSATYGAMGAPVFSGPIQEELFNNKELAGVPAVVRSVDRIDFNPGDGVAPAPGFSHEFYSIRWTGRIDLKQTGKYDLMTNADDGIRVFVDGRGLLNDWSDHPSRTKLVTTRLTKGRHQITVEYFQGTLGAIAQFGLVPTRNGASEFGAESLERVVSDADAVVLCLGYGQDTASNSLARPYDSFWPPNWARDADLVESEDSDRRFVLPQVQLETLRRVTRKNPRTVVVINAGGGVDLNGWLDDVAGLLWAFYPGQEGGTAIAEALFGRQNPSGKLPFTLARHYDDHPSARYYNMNEEGKTPYTEGLLVGYRGFDAAGIAPEFPFGFGLSYTSFAYDEPELQQHSDGRVTVSFTIKNTGSRAGDEIAQVYVAPPPGMQRPPQKLEAFTHVKLAPGAEQRAVVELLPRAFSYWEDGWKIDSGHYAIHIGGSSRDRKLTLGVELKSANLGR